MSDLERPGDERGWGTGESDDIEQSSENVLEGWPATSVDEPPEAPAEPESESFAPVAEPDVEPEPEPGPEPAAEPDVEPEPGLEPAAEREVVEEPSAPERPLASAEPPGTSSWLAPDHPTTVPPSIRRVLIGSPSRRESARRSRP